MNYHWPNGIRNHTGSRCAACGQLIGKRPHRCASVEIKGLRHCTTCGKLLRSDNYERWKTKCGPCEKKIWRDKLRRKRSELKQQFGGKCQRCGYSKCQAALHFHHKYGKTDQYRGKMNLKEILEHPDWFELLCANCHAEEHLQPKENALSNLQRSGSKGSLAGT